MSEAIVYTPGAPREARRKEKVTLAGGTYYVWVWGMTLADSTQILERSARPDVDRRGGHNPSMAVVMQIQLSCYRSDQADAARVWDDTTRHDIYVLPMADMTGLIAAINRVNGQDATEQEILRDFSRAASESST